MSDLSTNDLSTSDLATRILADHHDMDELLLLHQEALIEQDMVEALARFEVFHARLRAHIELENCELLPLHEALPTPRWRTQVYALEHDKILELAAKIHERLQSPVLKRGQAQRRWIIDLLDSERTLKNVVEHHEEREEKGMLPELGLVPFPAP